MLTLEKILPLLEPTLQTEARYADSIEEIVQLSIAISLKRIAATLEESLQRPTKVEISGSVDNRNHY